MEVKMGWWFRVSFAFTCAAVFQGLMIVFSSVCFPSWSKIHGS